MTLFKESLSISAHFPKPAIYTPPQCDLQHDSSGISSETLFLSLANAKVSLENVNNFG